jgi:penicillin-binding protein 1A
MLLLAVVVIAGRAMFDLLLVVTPGADDAAARTAAQMAEHPGTSGLTTVPAKLAAAVLATEDHRFYNHSGVDPLSVGRVVIGVVQGRDEGGATIEVQLAKLLYSDGPGGKPGQLDLLGLAIKLDRSYSKDELLTMYLNVAYFGHGFYGAQAASVGYFHLAPSDLDWNQAALLAGLLQAPTAYDPFVHPASALARRHHVLDRLVATGALTPVVASGLDAQGLELYSSP